MLAAPFHKSLHLPFSSSYCNSIVQCLYYSSPFREHVINFPSRSPPEALERMPPLLPRLNTDLGTHTNGQSSALSPSKPRPSFSGPNQAGARKPAVSPGAVVSPTGIKPEENKDSPEYKKKMAMAAGPVLNMDYENSSTYGMSESLFTSLKDIFEAIIAHRSRIGIVSPNKFLEILRRENEMFRTAMHQDAHEFLNYLLNEVVENVEQFARQKTLRSENGNGDEHNSSENSATPDMTPDRKSNISVNNTGWVHELFEGTLTSETRCLTCENTSQRDEAFLDLSVDLDQHSSVTSCLRKFSEEEMLCERNKFHCDNCGGLQEAEKRMKIKRLPKILALHLKRFKYTEDLQRLQKLFHRVVYPYYLRLFNTTDDAEDPDRLYELYAVVVHIGGGPYHGHYVSIIKTQDRGWLLFDDEMVEPVDKSYVRNFFGGENVLACAYVLFYQETTFEAMQKEQEAEGLAAEKSASQAEQDSAIMSAKQNGMHNGVLNGHPLNHQVTTPIDENEEQFANLNHAATAPPVPTLETTSFETPASPFPKLSPKKSTLQFRKTRTKEEKEKKAEERERRAQEKAQEKEAAEQARLKQKEMTLKRRETFKKQEDDLRTALEASKTTKVEEDKRRQEEDTNDASKEATKDEKKDKDKGNGTSKGALNRFRHTSMSLRHKPKFWSKEKEKNAESGDKETVPELPSAFTADGDGSETMSKSASDRKSGSDKQEKEKDKDKDKLKNRFSLGRKKSTVIF